jgi:hypothetical protein
MKVVQYKLTSTVPILFHNVRSMLIEKPARMKHDVFEETDKKFKGSCYLGDDEVTAVIPGDLIQAALVVAAKKSGMRVTGKRYGYADLIKSALFIPEALSLGVPYTSLEKNKAFVVISRSKVLRVRPSMQKWEGTIELHVGDEIPLEVLDELMTFAGSFVGIGDWRPKFGRFNAKRV